MTKEQLEQGQKLKTKIEHLKRKLEVLKALRPKNPYDTPHGVDSITFNMVDADGRRDTFSVTVDDTFDSVETMNLFIKGCIEDFEGEIEQAENQFKEL